MDNLDYRDFDEIDNYWVKYEGQFSDDDKNGQGKYTFSNGEYFVGEFKDDLANGPGTFYQKKGGQFVPVSGIWRDNRMQ